MLSLTATSEETTWLEANPLAPVVSYDSGLLDLKMCKPGLSADEFLGKLIPCRTFARSEYVETSCSFRFGGKLYFFTGMRVDKGPVATFNPVFTEVSVDDDARDGPVGVSWRNVNEDVAQMLFRSAEFTAALTPVLREACLQRGIDEYLVEVGENLAGIGVVEGFQCYDPSTGLFEYRQYVVSRSPVVDQLVQWFGTQELKEIALKLAYHALGEPGLAGPGRA